MNRTQYNGIRKRGSSNKSGNNKWISKIQINTESNAYANVIKDTDNFSHRKDKSSFLSTNRGFPFDQSSKIKNEDSKKILPNIGK